MDRVFPLAKLSTSLRYVTFPFEHNLRIKHRLMNIFESFSLVNANEATYEPFRFEYSRFLVTNGAIHVLFLFEN